MAESFFNNSAMKVVRFCGFFKLRDDKFFKLMMFLDAGIFIILTIFSALITSNSNYVAPAAVILALSAIMVCLSLIVIVVFIVQAKFHMMLHGLYVWSRTISYFVVSAFICWLTVLVIMDQSSGGNDFAVYTKTGSVILTLGLLVFFAFNINWSFTLRAILHDVQETEQELVESNDENQKEGSLGGSFASKDDASHGHNHKPGQKTQYVSQEIEIADV